SGRDVAGRAAGRPPPDRTYRDRREQRPGGRCGRTSRRGVARLPVRDRACETNRADLETRVLRRRSRLGRRPDGRSGRRSVAPHGNGMRMRVTVSFYARLRELAGCRTWACEVRPAATVADVWRVAETQFPSVSALAGRIS